MNRTLFYFNKSSIAKACEKVNQFCQSFNNAGHDIKVYQVPGDINNKKSSLFVGSSDPNKISLLVRYINSVIKDHDWKADGIEGFEEARGSNLEDWPDEAADPMAEFYNLNPGVKPKDAEPKTFVYFFM